LKRERILEVEVSMICCWVVSFVGNVAKNDFDDDANKEIGEVARKEVGARFVSDLTASDPTLVLITFLANIVGKCSWKKNDWKIFKVTTKRLGSW